MNRYLIRRLLFVPVTLFGVVTIVFFILRILPSDMASILLAGSDQAVRQADIDNLREQLGLDRPVLEQYVTWIGHVVRLDFGNSLRTGTPISTDLARRFPVTLQLAVMVTLFSTIIAIPAGVIAAVKQNSFIDQALRIVSVAGLAVPSFWLGIIIIIVLVLFFGWSQPLFWARPWEDPSANLEAMFWPVVAVGIRQIALSMRMVRATMLDVIREDYIRTARAKGLGDRVVVLGHALKNAILPVVTLIGLEFATLFGGLIIVETVFNVPGIGRYLVQAIMTRDYPVVQAVVILIALIVMLSNLTVDLLYGRLDPRIRVS
jgi:peptide/nickel transport system permease protein